MLQKVRRDFVLIAYNKLQTFGKTIFGTQVVWPRGHGIWVVLPQSVLSYSYVSNYSFNFAFEHIV
jgi:hypothetical protein